MCSSDLEVLVKCRDGPFTESVSLRVVGGRDAEIDVELAVDLYREFGGKLRTVVRGDMSWESVKAPISLMYVIATSAAVQVVFVVRLCCAFVNLSVTTRIALKPSDAGNSTTKSIAISSKGRSPVDIGTNFVCLLSQSALLF